MEEPPGKKSTRVAQVVCAPSRVSETFLEDWGELTMTSLVPGALVNAKTVKILDDGLEMLFLDFFRGTVDPFHLAAPPATWKEAFPVGKSTPARILYVDPVSKRIGLTLLPSLLSFQPPVGLPSLGAIFEEAVVLRVDKNVGLLLQLAAGEGEAPALGFAHVSALSDKKVEKVRAGLSDKDVERVRAGLSDKMVAKAVVSDSRVALSRYRHPVPCAADREGLQSRPGRALPRHWIPPNGLPLHGFPQGFRPCPDNPLC